MDQPPKNEQNISADALIAEIRAAFKDVSRNGGISWEECVVLDNYGDDLELYEARKSERDTHWEQLVDDQEWQPFPGIGGFSFIDHIGFRYYLPVTMIRFIRGDLSEGYSGHLLGEINRFVRSSSIPWTSEQLRCIARFILFMARYEEAREHRDDDNAWLKGLNEYWNKHLNPET